MYFYGKTKNLQKLGAKMGNPKKDKSKKMKLIVSNWFLIIYLNSTSLDTGVNNFLKLQWELKNNRITVFRLCAQGTPIMTFEQWQANLCA